MRVLCFGSLNIDYVYAVPHFTGAGETLAATARHTFPGGKGLNQSVAMARAGLEVWHAGAVGKDGGFLTELLMQEGVRTECVTVLPEVPTGHAVIQTEPGGNNCILLYGGANRAVTEEMADEVLRHFGAGDLLVLQNEISALGHIIAAGKARGMTVVLNPSPMDDTIAALPLENVDLILLNEVEAGQLSGQTVTAENAAEAADELRRRFPTADIVLTLGAQGAVYAGSESFSIPAVPVDAVDTTAAGDTFTGYFLAGIAGGLTPRAAMERAAKAAAIACTRPGAAPSIPRAAEVDG